MSGQANYAILQQVAKEEGFEDNFNTLYELQVLLFNLSNPNT